jgi:hypothetical protein
MYAIYIMLIYTHTCLTYVPQHVCHLDNAHLHTHTHVSHLCTTACVPLRLFSSTHTQTHTRSATVSGVPPGFVRMVSKWGLHETVVMVSHTHTHMHAHTHACTHTCMHTHSHVYTCMQVGPPRDNGPGEPHTHTHSCTHAHACTHIRML